MVAVSVVEKFYTLALFERGDNFTENIYLVLSGVDTL